MYLTKLKLPLSSPNVRAALHDSQNMHRMVTGFFGTDRKRADLLYRSRIRGVFAELYLYSEQPVNPERLLPGMELVAQRELSFWLASMETGQVYSFQLLTAPFKKVAEEGAKNSRRRALRTQEERLAWLERKAEQGGFRILSVQETPGEKKTAVHPAERGGRLTVDAWCYDGHLVITDADAFRRSFREGIGPGKAYGLGMLLLAGG